MLEPMWRLHPRGAANRGVCVDSDGAMLGPDCVLVERAASGYRAAKREPVCDIQRIIRLDKDDPNWLYEQSQRIADALDRGEIALAQIYGLRIPVRDLGDGQLKQLAAIATHTKAGFNPAEPRIPKGDHGGGQWTSGGASEAADLQAHLIEAGYMLPPGMWDALKALYRIYTAPGSTVASLEDYLAERGLKLDELPSVIRSLFDSAKPLAELQTDKPPRGFDTEAQLKSYLGAPLPGYEWHHIIEQTGQWRPDLTSLEGVRTWIQNTNNMVMVPVIKHYCVNGIMSSKPEGSDLRVRDVLRFHNPVFQRVVGLELLKICGAIR